MEWRNQYKRGQPVTQILPSRACPSNVEAAESAVGRRTGAGIQVVLAQILAPNDELLS